MKNVNAKQTKLELQAVMKGVGAHGTVHVPGVVKSDKRSWCDKDLQVVSDAWNMEVM